MSKLKNILNWIIGLSLADLGVALCTKSNFGLSMIGASPYILHVWLRDTFSWFTQGTAEYFWEGFLLIIGCIILRQFKAKYLLSFATAVVAGLIIDFWLLVLGGNGAYDTIPLRIFALTAGTLCTSCGIAFLFNTNLPIQVYELVVKEFSVKYNKNLNKVKYVNDLILLAVALILSFVLTHKLTGIGIGTIIITFVNAPLIGVFRKFIEGLEIIKENDS